MALATLSGLPIFAGRLVLPFSGLWHASVALDVAQDIAGPQVLSIAGVPWSCGYVRAIDFAGRRGALLVAGAAGWRKTISYKQYGQGSIPTQAVLSDAAAACGELPPVLDPSVPPTAGMAWLRGSGPASNVLNQLLGDGWWSDSAGRVQTAPRGGVVPSPFQALDVDGSAGSYQISSDAPSDWLPGRSFAGPTVSGTISRVEFDFKGDTTRLTVLVP